MRKIVFCAVFICLLGHALIMWFSAIGAVCVWGELGGGGGGDYFCVVVWWFWRVSCSLFCSLMQDVMVLFLNLLLLLFIPIYTIVRYSFCV